MVAIRLLTALFSVNVALLLPCAGHAATPQLARASNSVVASGFAVNTPTAWPTNTAALPRLGRSSAPPVDWLWAYRHPALGRSSPDPWQSLPTLAAERLGWGEVPLMLSRDECPAPNAITFRGHHESDAFRVLDCDGSVAPGALDRLSVLARPWKVSRPEVPLPSTPTPAAGAGEWVPGVRLLHPRVFWLVQHIADRFPGRALRIVSGYRPGQGAHGKGRALDLTVSGVDNVDLFRFCRTLPDVGCGYSPNSTFVHVDVRPAGTGHAMWVDASGPGEKAKYVDGWPGVVAPGSRQWTWRPPMTAARRTDLEATRR